MKTVWTANAQEVIDTLIYSGAETYDWYRKLDITDEEQIVCKMETGETTDDGKIITKSVTFTPRRAKEVVNAIIKEKKAGWQVVLSAVDSDDFDSDASDVVLQHIVLGDLVFG